MKTQENVKLRGLLDLPNELLLMTISFLSVPNIRILGRSCRKLRFLVIHYLVRYHYSTGIFVLPAEIILNIAQYVRHPKHLSRFAQATQWYYPFITRTIALVNIRYHDNSLLCYAAQKNLISMARTMVHLGGDVNRKLRSKRVTALSFAASCGHTEMVNLLLSLGASQLVSGQRIPLLIAILRRHESTALVLSRNIVPYSAKPGKIDWNPLVNACKMKLVRLVCYMLGGHKVANPSFKHPYNVALRTVVRQDLSKGDINLIKREIHQDVYQIVLMLLHHGANPRFASELSWRHPDPRVRAVLGDPVSEKILESNWNEIAGRSSLLKDDGMDILHPLPPDLRLQAGLLEYLKPTKNLAGQLLDDDLISEYELGDSEVISSIYAVTDTESRKSRAFGMSEVVNPFDISAYPQLAPTRTSSQDGPEKFWATMPKTVQSIPYRGSQFNPNKAKLREKPTVKEEFPKLGKGTKVCTRANENIWMDFAKKNFSRKEEENPVKTAEKAGNSTKTAVRSSKKKKWQPLAI